MPRPDKSHGQEDRMLVHEDEKARALYLRQMELVPPEVGIFDEPTRCYKVNLEWGKIVMGMVSWLAEVAPWRDAENEGYFGIEEILRFMQGDNCGSDEMPTLFRQNPVNDCQLQQSIDNGESWSLIFDFSLCELNVQVDQGGNNYDFSRDAETTMNEFVTNYTTVNNFAPGLVYDASGEDFYRDEALCYAISVFYDSILALKLEQTRTAGGFRPLALLVGATIGAIITVFTAGVAGPIIGALIAAFLYAVPEWDADNDEARWNEVKDDIVCCIYTNLKGATVSEATFETALDGCDLDSPATSVALEIEQLLDDDEVFIMFLKLWEEGYRFGKIGILPACPCADSDEPWEYDSDFPVDPNGWVAQVRSSGNALATWAETSGWTQVSTLATTPNGYWRVTELVVRFDRPVYITEITMVFNLTKGSFASDSTSYRINGLLENSLVSTVVVNNSAATNGTGKTVTLEPNQMLDEISLLVRSSMQVTASYSGATKIVSCHIEGTGQIPDELTQTLE